MCYLLRYKRLGLRLAGLSWRQLDSTRLINANSHVSRNDFGRNRYNADDYDAHCYERTARFYDYDVHIPATFGEFGGIGYNIEGIPSNMMFRDPANGSVVEADRA